MKIQPGAPPVELSERIQLLRHAHTTRRRIYTHTRSARLQRDKDVVQSDEWETGESQFSSGHWQKTEHVLSHFNWLNQDNENKREAPEE